MLDVGTGTGILALAAAKALKRSVVAGDIDPVAVAVARDNARLTRSRRICASTPRPASGTRSRGGAGASTSSSRTSSHDRCDGSPRRFQQYSPAAAR